MATNEPRPSGGGRRKASSRKRRNGAGSLYRRFEGGPWIMSWYDETGRRHERSTKLTDFTAADRILQKHIADAALRREGVIDPAMDRLARAGRVPLAQHVADYIAHCSALRQDKKNVAQKKHHLEALLKATGATRFGQLTIERLAGQMRELMALGRSARTANFVRQIAVAFGSWMVKSGRADVNPFRAVTTIDERKDRRRRRRPLAQDELSRLLEVGAARGRLSLYLLALFAGLRRGDLKRLEWRDIDLDRSTVTIRAGKARREDVVPLHPQLREALVELRERSMSVPTATVFSPMPSTRAVLDDFRAAGLARWEDATNRAGLKVRRLTTRDDAGTFVDLHSLRTTLATMLARNGVAPQVAQQVLRHANYKTTQAAYTALHLSDATSAIATLPTIRVGALSAATGTDDDSTCVAPVAETRNPHGNRRAESMPQCAPTNTGAALKDQRTPRRAARNPNNEAALQTTMHMERQKRAKGVEPSTFSLEGCQRSDVSSDAPQDCDGPVLSIRNLHGDAPHDLAAAIAEWLDGCPVTLPDSVRASIEAALAALIAASDGGG